MANFQVSGPEGATPPTQPGVGGAQMAGGFGWTIGQAGDLANSIAQEVAKFLAEIKVMTELLKKETAVQQWMAQWQTDYNQYGSDSNQTKADEKKMLEALAALKKFGAEGYKQVIAQVGAQFNLPQGQIQEAMANAGGLINQVLNSSGAGTTNVISVLERLAQGTPGAVNFNQALEAWWKAKPGSKEEQAAEQRFATALHSTLILVGSGSSKVTQFQIGWQNLIGQVSDVGQVLQAQMGVQKSSIEALYTGMAKIASKAFSTIQTMIRLTGNV
ncbi:MAG: hypothetical protein AB7F31_05750 [Parachlamydiales bacterium]